MSLQCNIFLEIWLSVICTYGIGRKERHIHLLYQTVIDRMTCLDIVVSYDNSIISYLLDHTGIQMLGKSIYIIEIICSIISLKAVSSIKKHNVFSPFCPSQAVRIP